ncbi:Exocyst complex component 2 [Lemmus lemmus]
MSRSRQPPLVTGISPNEGIPWTKVTIRGENLGTGPTDLIGLTICGHNCLLTAEWMSASKIVCRVGQAKNDKGDIIVTTKSGGKGTSTVSFKLLKPEKIGILDQSAVWVDEMNYYDMRTDRNKGIPPLSLRPANPLGIEIEKSKLPQKDLEALFHGMSADFTSENFSAAWYLIENHSTTSFEQLKMAVTNLKRQANKKSEGSLASVKGGLSTFFEAQDALSAIHQKLEADGTEKVEGSMTQKLENVLNSVRNYLKEALVNIIAVHAEVFTVSKELVPRVLSRVIEAVSEELSRLMQCVSSFSRNGALQARLEICALRDTVAIYLTPESRSSFKQALEALPQLASGADKKLLEELLNKFKSSMHLQLACFQAASPTMIKT